MTRPLFDSVIADRHLRVVASERADGDVHPWHVDHVTLASRQLDITGRRWTLLDQAHGTEVVTAPSAGVDGVGDVIVTTAVDTHVAVWAADCAPVVLAADDGTLVVAHSGWRGLAAGVADVAVATATRDGGSIVAAVLGPVIHPCCYEFGIDDIDTIPDAVAGRTARGPTALDVPRTIAASLARHGVVLDVIGPCTGCDDRWFSHRTRTDTGRHAVVAWWEGVA